LAIDFAKSGNLREADGQLAVALQLCAGDPDLLYNRSLVLLQMGKLDRALHNYLWAEASSKPPLSSVSRRAFFALLAPAEEAAGNRRLAQAARRKADDPASRR